MGNHKISLIKQTIFGLILTMTLYANAATITTAGKSPLLQNPLVSVYINAHGCAYQILINDVPIMTDERGIPVTVDIPVNEWLKSGSNTLSMKLTPAEEAKTLVEQQQLCSATAALQVRQSGTPDSDNQVISKIHYQAKPDDLTTDKMTYAESSAAGDFNSKNGFKADDKGNVKISPINIIPLKGEYGEGVNISRTINMPLVFPEWEWFKGDKIADNENTKLELIQQYKKIWELIYHKNISALTPILAERTKELDEAYFQHNNQMSIIPNLKDLINNHNETFGAFIPGPEYVKLEIYGDGRLANLTSWQGEPVIFFNSNNDSGHTNLPFIFTRIANKWVVIR